MYAPPPSISAIRTTPNSNVVLGQGCNRVDAPNTLILNNLESVSLRLTFSSIISECVPWACYFISFLSFHSLLNEDHNSNLEFIVKNKRDDMIYEVPQNKAPIEYLNNLVIKSAVTKIPWKSKIPSHLSVLPSGVLICSPLFGCHSRVSESCCLELLGDRATNWARVNRTSAILMVCGKRVISPRSSNPVIRKDFYSA